MVHPFLQALRSGRVLLMDGAMGTELQRAGMPSNACYESWNLTNPERVLAIHRAYVAAGAEVLLTNTFQANPVALARHGLNAQLHPICAAGVQLASTAANENCFVLGDWTPFEVPPADIPTHLLPPWQHADALLLETCSDVRPALGLAAGMKKAMGQPGQSWHPLLMSFTFHRNPAGELRTFHNFTPEAVALRAAGLGIAALTMWGTRWSGRVARRVAGWGIAALGVNCGRDISMDDCVEIVRRYRSVTDLPLFARPNAGTPQSVDGLWVYPHTPEQMAAKLPALLAAGVAMVGGCCGTTPAHVAAFHSVVEAWNAGRGAR
jgi:methionine synthase I (cobalamin-dependent)